MIKERGDKGTEETGLFHKGTEKQGSSHGVALNPQVAPDGQERGDGAREPFGLTVAGRRDETWPLRVINLEPIDGKKHLGGGDAEIVTRLLRRLEDDGTPALLIEGNGGLRTQALSVHDELAAPGPAGVQVVVARPSIDVELIVAEHAGEVGRGIVHVHRPQVDPAVRRAGDVEHRLIAHVILGVLLINEDPPSAPGQPLAIRGRLVLHDRAGVVETAADEQRAENGDHRPYRDIVRRVTAATAPIEVALKNVIALAPLAGDDLGLAAGAASGIPAVGEPVGAGPSPRDGCARGLQGKVEIRVALPSESRLHGPAALGILNEVIKGEVIKGRRNRALRNRALPKGTEQQVIKGRRNRALP